jgi:hypothetical protein
MEMECKLIKICGIEWNDRELLWNGNGIQRRKNKLY